MKITDTNEIKFQTIGTRAVVSKEITPEQAAKILQKNPNITQVDTPTGYFPRDTMTPFALDHATGQLYKADETGKYHLLPKP
jgi:hypothetical protein